MQDFNGFIERLEEVLKTNGGSVRSVSAAGTPTSFQNFWAEFVLTQEPQPRQQAREEGGFFGEA
jgi:hypothetical protein